MVFAADGQYRVSVYLLLAGITLDTLDGVVARWLKATSKIGQELDSFSDAISAVAAPAFLLYHCLLRDLGWRGMLVSLFYLLCGVFRLARFNLTSDWHQKAGLTTGVPVPITASFIMAMVLMHEEMPTVVVVGVVLGLGLLMVSRVALPNLKGKSLISAMLAVGIVNFYCVVLAPSWYTVGWWTFWNVLILICASDRGRATGAEGSLPGVPKPGPDPV